MRILRYVWILAILTTLTVTAQTVFQSALKGTYQELMKQGWEFPPTGAAPSPEGVTVTGAGEQKAVISD